MNNTELNQAEQIRSHYVQKEATQLDQLKALDRKVKAPATRFGWIFGSLSALILGSGMSLVMTDIGTVLNLTHPMIPGIAVGCVGLVLAIVTYPAYRSILARRRKKYAQEILALSQGLVES